MEAVSKHPPPSLVKEIQGILGMLNFYHGFLPATAQFLRPLKDALKGSRKGADLLQRTQEMLLAFKKIWKSSFAW